jgi:hypothetical protein
MLDPTSVVLLSVWVTATIAEIGLLGRLLQRVTEVETIVQERTTPARTDGGERP